ncbi:hypothetical protein KAI65_04765 [Candidatus Parcubacteria bacterium]|nr:hypothetical protein [Candidatus Parcubacteria bacterium]
MKKIKFNDKLFNIIPSPKEKNVLFIFHKKNGTIFQVEDATKELVLDLSSEKIEENIILNKYASKYDMKSIDKKNFKKIISEMKNNKVII